MEQYIVTGMSCAACSARVEKAVSAVEGVTSWCMVLRNKDRSYVYETMFFWKINVSFS